MMLPKFSFYDQFGYILVGFYQIFSFWVFSLLIGFPLGIGLGNLLKPEYAIPFVLLTYFMGHLVQALSNLLDRKEKKEKQSHQDISSALLEKACTFFKLKTDTDRNTVWQYCYLYALANDFSGQIQLFNSMYSLYRGIWAASLVTAFFALLAYVARLAIYLYFAYSPCIIMSDWIILVFGGIFIIFSLVFSVRKKRFMKYMSEKTLITFDILSNDIVKK